MTDNEIIKALECCSKANCDDFYCNGCPYDNETYCAAEISKDTLDLINRLQAEVERLKTIAKKMHTWIFLNSCDEEKAYAECGLTDEENALLGYCGKIVFENKEMVGETNDE